MPTPTEQPPLVSVVLCTYNGSRFLTGQLDSLLAQTWPHLEIIAVDDASTDETVAILRRYAERDSRIRVAVNRHNLGFARNFAQALPLSSGTLIAPCDQDDLWHPDKIAVLVAAIAGHSLAYCDSELVDENGAPLGHRLSQVVSMGDLHDPLPFAFGNCVSGHAMLFERGLLKNALPVPDVFFHDWWLAAVAAADRGIVFCARALVQYRQHDRNVTERRLTEMRAEAGLVAEPSKGGLSGGASIAPGNGQRLRYLRDTERRLAAIAQLPGRHQGLAMRLLELWRAREKQWLSASLWRLMSRHQERLLALTGMSPRKRQRYCRELLAGIRLKRLTRRRAYTFD